MAVTPFGPARERADEPRPTRPGAAAGDRVRRAASHVRAGLAVLLVFAAPLVPGSTAREQATFGLIVAFAWIPLSALVSHLARRRPSVLADVAALLVDLSLLILVEVILEPQTVVLLAGLLLLVATATYVGGRWIGALGGVVGVAAISTLAAHSSRVDDVDAFAVVVYPVLLGVLAWLLDAVATERWQASAGLVQLHEKSDAILTGVGEAVVVTGPAGRIEQWNRAATTTFGCDADAARGRRCHDVLGLVQEVRDLDCSSGCALLGARAGGGAVEVEVWRESATGSRQPLLASVSPVLDAGGRLVEVVHSYRDITKLKHADEAKTLFLATASHELKTPLTVIRGFAQMLLLPEQHVGAEERQAALRAIDVRAGQLTAIVDRLLMSSRIESGRIDLTPVAVDVEPILRERADALERATGREVGVQVADDLPAPFCDLDALTTVVDHLLDNAVKYSPGGGPITVSAAGRPTGVEISVTDEGIGMTPEQAANCFDRFWQAEATDVRRFGGTGIGLYIVRSLVEGMDGSIEVDSSPGEGSSFRVVLRRADADADRGEQTMIREYMRQLGLVDREPAP